MRSREAAQEKEGESLQVGNIQGQYLSQLITGVILFLSFKNQIEYKQYFPKANITKNILSNFQNCHTAPGKQDCSQSNIQPFTKESCQAELRRKGLLNVVGACWPHRRVPARCAAALSLKRAPPPYAKSTRASAN